MTHPTKAIAPILLEDYYKITRERLTKKDLNDFFDKQDILKAMQRVTSVALHQECLVKPGLTLKAYYAGHVLGAAMFLARAHHDQYKVVYTGDFNATPDRHLAAAWIDPCAPDLIITESTYATLVRESKRRRETQLIRRILSCVKKDGKVLVPVFAVGRAQELCVLLDNVWRRLGLQVPVYFSTGLTEKANEYYRMFLPWTNEHIKHVHEHGQNPFHFAFIKPWQSEYATQPGPAVLFAAPGMMQSGTSLDVFRRWGPDPKNLIVLPGYCVNNTVGYRVLNYHRSPRTKDGAYEIMGWDRTDIILMKAQVESLSFSAHADQTGILQVLTMANPKAVMLVHGEKAKMELLKGKIEHELKVPCFMPPNGVVVNIPMENQVHVSVPMGDIIQSEYKKRLKLETSQCKGQVHMDMDMAMEKARLATTDSVTINECVVIGNKRGKEEDDPWKLIPVPDEYNVDTSNKKMMPCHFTFAMQLKYEPRTGCCATESDTPWRDPDAFKSAFQKAVESVTKEFSAEGLTVQVHQPEEPEEGEFVQSGDMGDDNVSWFQVNSVKVSDTQPGLMQLTWTYKDELIAGRILDVLDVALA